MKSFSEVTRLHQLQKPGRADVRRILSVKFLVLPLILLTLFCLALLTTEQLHVVAPMIAVISIVATFLGVIWSRDKVFPLFEIGTITVMVVAAYSVLPLIGYLGSGLSFTSVSDTRLQVYRPQPDQVGALAWLYVVYLLSFATSYLYMRRRASLKGAVALNAPSNSIPLTMAIVITLLAVYFLFLYVVFDIDLNPTYFGDDGMIARSFERLPLLVQQITQNLRGMRVILKLGFLILLFNRWRTTHWRNLIYLWLFIEVALTTFNMGARTELFILLLASLLLYHQLVKPLKATMISLFLVLLLAGALGYGFVRDFSRVDGDISWVSASNEFQSLYGTAFDIKARKENGSLGEIPWQIYVSDFAMLVPQQLLPFEKVDPSQWYLEVLRIRHTGAGLMFGVLSQAILGFGWIELMIRGLILGVIFGAIHRWYVLRASEFWVMLFYLFLCLWSYYSVRASTFYILVFILYRFLPLYLFIHVVNTALQRFNQPPTRLVTTTLRHRPTAT